MSRLINRGIRPSELDRLGEVIEQTDNERPYRQARRIVDVARDEARAVRVEEQLSARDATAGQRKNALKGALAIMAIALAASLVASDRFQDTAEAVVKDSTEAVTGLGNIAVTPLDATIGRAFDQLTVEGSPEPLDQTVTIDEYSAVQHISLTSSVIVEAEPSIVVVIDQP